MRIARTSCCSLIPSQRAQYCIECQLRTSTAAVSRTLASDVAGFAAMVGRESGRVKASDATECR